MYSNKLKDKSDAFADRIITCTHVLRERKAQPSIVSQLLRSGTSIGANVAEAQYAQSHKDLISKFEIALKEVNETEYWLERIYHDKCMTEREFKSMRNDCIAIRRILVSSVTTLKKKQNSENCN